MNANPMSDQFYAAAAAARRIVAAHAFPDSPVVVRPRGWVDEVSDDFMAAYRADPRGCLHLQSPQPVFGTLQEMGIVRCVGCYTLHALAGVRPPCDRCGGDSSDVCQGSVTVGPVVIVVSMCDACRAVTNAEQQG
ncbi:hypothetical protein AB0K21_21845 [Streptosporangium sp. NPDC049248]|uniref:hypothetical protein n=1 Tax=Streptosporangium sp. NPDC049248 TaxID=3155651 RepID=UPI00341CE4CB